MPYLAECIFGTLAAVGFICILKAVYDIIVSNYTRAEGTATLYLCADGTTPESERLLLAAAQTRRVYLPDLKIIFLEQNEAETHENIAAKFAARQEIMYIKKTTTKGS